jgi:hypothetical protein
MEDDFFTDFCRFVFGIFDYLFEQEEGKERTTECELTYVERVKLRNLAVVNQNQNVEPI